jgi:hypothetical protein
MGGGRYVGVIGVASIIESDRIENDRIEVWVSGIVTLLLCNSEIVMK